MLPGTSVDGYRESFDSQRSAKGRSSILGSAYVSGNLGANAAPSSGQPNDIILEHEKKRSSARDPSY